MGESVLSRRELLKIGGVGLTGALLGAAGAEAYQGTGEQCANSVRSSPNLRGNWEAVRDQFELRRDRIHMAGFLLASHPRPVRDAIETHRRGLDEDPVGYLNEQSGRLSGEVFAAAAEYLSANQAEIAITNSTTMGLGLLHGGLRLRDGQEILTTVHDHYALASALRLRAERTGATVRSIRLYQDLATVSRDEIVTSLLKAVRPQTRLVALTWVHSSTGLKLPIREIADALAELNHHRDEEERALLCVDGVHGLGVEDLSTEELGCDFFVAGCHKWLFGPRGTGLVWGKWDAWPAVTPIIPTFDGRALGEWLDAPSYAHWWTNYSAVYDQMPIAAAMTPGGFHSFEHRWALAQAFRFHREIGKLNVAKRIHGLNRGLKEGLEEISHVRLLTPIDDELSAGIVCFEVDGLSPTEVVERLGKRGIIASESPYHTSYARLAPSLLTSSEEVDETLYEVRRLAG